MTFQQLRYFLTCFELLSFKRTAEALYASPSTVTRQITALEEELGVLLFVRDTHRIYVTDEGWAFYLYAHIALDQIETFKSNLIATGKRAPDEKPDLVIACYSLDGAFRRIVSVLENASPSDKLKRRYGFYNPRPGDMMDAVLSGACHVGVDSEAMLTGYLDRIDTLFLHRCPFRIITGKNSPLFGRERVSTGELLKSFKNYGCFLPEQLGDLSSRGVPLNSAADLKALGEYTISLIPRILPFLNNFDSMSGNMLVLPGELIVGYSKETSTVNFEDESIATDFRLFWKKEEDSPDLKAFLQLVKRTAR